ncbi:methyl-accepting chemotaxis protein/methyl-accepting chemotaxis protein-3 (ribose and galactose sensor receptor) [Chitinivorax tropicus]|uniref:Methyl-accepting chemotaxis protein/methyl-accepting chemotaxis protein-3 (Ribose and galactose sensor receptor) n=1 Tax=Chitinivorax tropicus TaxID=714531 RepID=A0A840MQC2_9PROT|nr:methyl-accepting chemotaxis protein [Chitinivorax tropicus]MBB5019279.1 methyl-accepting chemotaxis protein/methyl-accepting chemotaxis protein-3 (ribose and galactose sensor receptor) [Chitinivorax tropicus]
MKLSTRLAIIVVSTIIGLITITMIALTTIKHTMQKEREMQITTLLRLTHKMVSHYQEQEQSGKLTKEAAQSQAKAAVKSMRFEDDYFFMRDMNDTMLIHPDPKREGKHDPGTKLPDGRYSAQVYRDAVANKPIGFAQTYVARPRSTDKEVKYPKLNGVIKFEPWGWIIGIGFFTDDIESTYWSYATSFILAGSIVVVVVVLLAFGMSRRIYAVLGGEPAYAAAVAVEIANGNLSQQVSTNQRHDSLLSSIARMQTSLRGMIDGIQQGSNALGGSAANLTAQMVHINDAARSSSDATTATAAAVQQMTSSVEQISQSARETELNSERSTVLAANGEKLVSQAAHEIQRVSDQIDSASQQIHGLMERSREIGGIAAVIKEIADQTNLLALNAAIEAARAGEQGRGFAVVADEVRKLAERTSGATEQITGMIQGIQHDTQSVVSSMQAVTPQVAKGVSMAEQAAESLREISEGARDTLGKIRSVAHATSEQSTASNSIASNIDRIAAMVDSAAESVRQANQTVRSLEQLSVDLRASVSQFRL